MNNRELIATHKIALLATGDEICNGDILNSNAQQIAKQLSSLGMQIGMHAVAADQITDIELIISFLLESHQALIITGGLGPTSDDLTRFALSNATKTSLIFHEPTWNYIVERLKKFGYHTPPESNKQQALFPEGATIIPNPYGTAAGCIMNIEGKFIFMLPGPPSECLPMVTYHVVPLLKKNKFSHTVFRKNWLLFGVSEGHIAEELDALTKPFQCVTGYRLFYPYIEFKLHSNNEKDFIALIDLVEKTISPYLIEGGSETASTLLKKKLESLNKKIYIIDNATGGCLESLLSTPKNRSHLFFKTEKSDDLSSPTFVLAGLDEYWKQEETTQARINLTLYYQKNTTVIENIIPYRGNRVKEYATEWACKEMIKLFKGNGLQLE